MFCDLPKLRKKCKKRETKEKSCFSTQDTLYFYKKSTIFTIFLAILDLN